MCHWGQSVVIVKRRGERKRERERREERGERGGRGWAREKDEDDKRDERFQGEGEGEGEGEGDAMRNYRSIEQERDVYLKRWDDLAICIVVLAGQGHHNPFVYPIDPISAEW